MNKKLNMISNEPLWQRQPTECLSASVRALPALLGIGETHLEHCVLFRAKRREWTGMCPVKTVKMTVIGTPDTEVAETSGAGQLGEGKPRGNLSRCVNPSKSMNTSLMKNKKPGFCYWYPVKGLQAIDRNWSTRHFNWIWEKNIFTLRLMKVWNWLWVLMPEGVKTWLDTVLHSLCIEQEGCTKWPPNAPSTILWLHKMSWKLDK